MERIIRAVPNLFTLLNLCFGVIALAVIVNHMPLASTLFVLGAAVCDVLDGKVARQLKVSSEFGVELDSLADVVSFGVVPALQAYEAVPHHFVSTLALLVFPVAGALRLARFNTHRTVDYFEGMPIPAAGILIGLALWIPALHRILPYFVLILSLLMISKLRIQKL